MRARERRRLERTAYHEAGHAVALVLLGRGLGKEVSIIPNDEHGSLGYCSIRRMGPTFHPDAGASPREVRIIENLIVALCAGLCAEARLLGRKSWRGARADMSRAVDLACYVTGSDRQAGAYVDWLLICAEEFVADPLRWVVIERLAEELLQHRRIGGRTARRLIIQALLNPGQEVLDRVSQESVARLQPAADEDEVAE